MQIATVQNQIDECLDQEKEDLDDSGSHKSKEGKNGSLSCRRTAVGCKEDIEKIQEYYYNYASEHENVSESSSANIVVCMEEGETSAATASSSTTTPPHYIILCEESKKREAQKSSVRGMLVWYFGYSTWKGKVMNVDCILSDTEEVEKMLISAIVQIAKRLELGRVVYQIKGRDQVKSLAQKYDFDILNEWLTLQMTNHTMKSFLDTIHTWDNQLIFQKSKSSSPPNNITTINDIRTCINDVLSFMNPAMVRKTNHDKFQLRYACKDDAKSMLNLVQGLALYEKELHEVDVDEFTYQIDGSGENPLYHCILLEKIDTTNNNNDGNTSNETNENVVGMGCFYFGYKTRKNGKDGKDSNVSYERFLFLEDLFIQKAYRGNGFGKAIMYTLAQLSINLNCNRFVWQALDWNEPALKFYNSIGAVVCEGLMTLRLDKKRIETFSR